MFHSKIKPYLITCLLFLTFQASFSQDTLNVNFKFNNTPLKEVISTIENKTDYRFFYLDEWLGNTTITGDYDNESITSLLDSVLNNTLLNFYIAQDQRVILTQNSIIYDELPEGFFPMEDEIITETTAQSKNVAPVFYQKESTKKRKPIETVRIGKETPNRKRTYRLKGTITNAVNGQALPNLAIVLSTNTSVGTTTDDQGQYQLTLPSGTNLLDFKLLGMESLTKRVILYNNGTLDISLDEDYEELGEVLIAANKNKNVEDAKTGAETIDVKAIKNIPLVLGERDILKVAATLPGISKAGEGATGFNVRGGKEDQNLILLDDAVIYNPSHFFGIFSAINPFTTGSVDIYKGSIPAEYGGRLSSVFDLKTRDANTVKFAGEGSIGPVTGNLALEIPLTKDKAAIMIGARATYSDYILKLLDEESLKNSNASFYDAIVKYNYKINDNNSIKATAYFSKDKYRITSDSIFSYSNSLVSLAYNHRFNDNNKASLVISNSQYNFDINYDGDTNTDFDLGYKINESQLKLKFDTKVKKKHSLNYGIQGKLYNVEPGTIEPKNDESIVFNRVIPKERAFEGGIFLEDEFKITDAFQINAGVRYSFFAALGPSIQRQYEANSPITDASVIDSLSFGKNESIKTYSGPEARLSFRYSFTPTFSVKAGYNNTYQYIHTLSNNTTVSPTDTYKLSDYNIEPEKASQYSLGFYKNLNNDTYELSLEGYYKKSDNILDFKTGANLLLNDHVETELLQGEGKAYGIEFLLKKKKGKLNGWLSYTYSRALIRLDSDFSEDIVNSGDFFPSNYDKPHDFNIVANYKLTQRFSLSGNFVYQTGRPITYPVGSYVINNSEFVTYSDRNAFRIPDYYRLDLSLNIEGNHKLKKLAHSFWSFSVYNVLGRNNPYSVFFVVENGNVKAFQSSIFSVPVPTITYNFKF
ncbi:TonB-dependent receptor domain-containing protein [Aequorivita capsosiphonis]|uniref:TonB-dependent receptor domain-containing protein n=1 Tax=Aequorivita capsosiphonis TaxID=487317 RepID=UPI0003F9EBC2|nr:TonB-dependent receptor [Aequorivita capsosiphonis]